MLARLSSGWFAVALMVHVSAVGAWAAELSETRFFDWSYYSSRAWQAAERGALDEAAHRFNLAIDVLRPEWERAPRLMARSYADLAWIRYRQGRFDEARPLAQWALEVRTARSGAESEFVAQSLYQLAMIEEAQARYAQSESYLRRSLAVWEKRLGRYDISVSYYLIELARILRAQHKWDEAEAIYRRVLGQPEQGLPPKHPFRVASLIGLGTIYLAKGESIRAGFQNTQLLAMLPAMRPADVLELSEPLSRYVQTLKRAGETDGASKLERAAELVLAKADTNARGQTETERRVLRAVKGVPARSAAPSLAPSASPRG